MNFFNCKEITGKFPGTVFWGDAVPSRVGTSRRYLNTCGVLCSGYPYSFFMMAMVIVVMTMMMNGGGGGGDDIGGGGDTIRTQMKYVTSTHIFSLNHRRYR